MASFVDELFIKKKKMWAGNSSEGGASEGESVTEYGACDGWKCEWGRCM